MKQLSSLILLAAACSGDAVGGSPDAGTTEVTDGGAGEPDAPLPVEPDLSCLSQPPSPPTMAVNPMVLGGRVLAFTTTGGPMPVDAADVALFRAGQGVVLARTQSAASGAFSTGAVTNNGQPVHAYVK